MTTAPPSFSSFLLLLLLPLQCRIVDELRERADGLVSSMEGAQKALQDILTYDGMDATFSSYYYYYYLLLQR